MGNIAVQWSMDIGQSIAESRSTEMFWMKNHSSAYFILLPWPILGKFIILVPLLRQNSLPHITVFTINSTESKEWMNLSLHASLWTLHRLRLAQTLTPLLPRKLWNIGSIYNFAAKIIGSKGKKRGKGSIGANLICCLFEYQSALHRWNRTAAGQDVEHSRVNIKANIQQLNNKFCMCKRN